jgi:hypothetical protein
MLSLITQSGAVAVLLLGFMALLKGLLRTKFELEQVQRASEAAVTRLDGRIRQLSEEHERELVTVRAEAAARVASVEKDRDFFRDIAFRALHASGRVADVADRALSRAEGMGGGQS